MMPPSEAPRRLRRATTPRPAPPTRATPDQRAPTTAKPWSQRNTPGPRTVPPRRQPARRPPPLTRARASMRPRNPDPRLHTRQAQRQITGEHPMNRIDPEPCLTPGAGSGSILHLHCVSQIITAAMKQRTIHDRGNPQRGKQKQPARFAPARSRRGSRASICHASAAGKLHLRLAWPTALVAAVGGCHRCALACPGDRMYAGPPASAENRGSSALTTWRADVARLSNDDCK